MGDYRIITGNKPILHRDSHRGDFIVDELAKRL